MFPNVGKELKNWAKFFFFVIFIPFCLAGLVVFCGSIGQGPKAFFGGLIVMAIIVVVGYFIARLNCILLYAFGELVDTNMEINRKLSADKPGTQPQASCTEQTNCEQYDYRWARNEKEAFLETDDGSWYCAYCGTKNDAKASSCYICGGKEKE